MSKKITVTVPVNGPVKIETSGFVGSSCEDATAGLEKALAGERDSNDRKPEFFETEAVSEQEAFGG